jgi:tetratricopeptide (TPR) repeat protein
MCRCLRRVIWELFPAHHHGAELGTSSASGKKSPADRTLGVSPGPPIGAIVRGSHDRTRTLRELWAPPGRDVFGMPRERDRAYDRFVQFLSSWAHTMDRRNALWMLGLAVSAASLPLPVIIDGDEQQRVASVLSAPGRVDAQTIEHIEAVLWHCARQDNVLGPRAVLNTVLAQRDLARALAPECPPALRPRMLSALSEASRQAGWTSYNLKLFDHADYYYEDARAVAHQSGNIALGAFVLCQMSQLATWQGKPHTGIDQAVSAGQWAHRTDDLRLRAFASDIAARAYAADGQRDACLAALDTAHTTLTAAGDRTPSYGLFYDEALHMSFRGECHLKLGEADHAVSYAQQSLATLDRSCVRDVAMTTIDLGQAYTQRKEVDEAARLLGDAGDIAARNSSARLTERLHQARAMLQPWEHTTAVRQLDDRLASYRT